MSTTTTPLVPGNWYHIYNRGINGQTLFFEEKNYLFFLQLMAKHLPGIAEVYAYCLLGNHFHLLVRICDEPAKKPHLGFSHWFNAYSQAVNKQLGRTGGLFERPFRRKLIQSERYRGQVLYYIHSNPAHHNLCRDFRRYPHTSYQSMLASAPTKLMRDEALAWFGGREEFVAFHQLEHDLSVIEDVIIEE